MKTLLIHSYTVALFPPKDPSSGRIVYTHMDMEEAGRLAAKLADTGAALAAVGGVDWDRELSPWQAPRAFRGGRDFSGGGEAYLRTLTEELLPACEEALGLTGASRAIAGYSLAGLFSLYALYRTAAFDRAACVSGSLWFDGFVDFMGETPLYAAPERVYLSLGDRESMTKNPRLKSVGECTRAAAELLCRSGVDTVLAMNPGGHFQDVTERMSKGIGWLLAP